MIHPGQTRREKSRSPASGSTSRPCWATAATRTAPGTSCSIRQADRLRPPYGLQPRHGRRVCGRRSTQLQAQKIRGLILDLRFNPGGLLTSAVDVSSLFISKGRIVSTEGRNSPNACGTPAARRLRGLSHGVLVNRYQASASEIVAGLPARPPAGGDRRRADLGQGERAERHRAGGRPQRA